MRIGCDVIRGEEEICIMAIGLGQLIGRCVGRDKRSGRFVSLSRWRVAGDYTGGTIEFERRPNPRQAPALAAWLVIGIVLVVVTAAVPEAAMIVELSALVMRLGSKAVRGIGGYVEREFVQEWRLAMGLLPFGAGLLWLTVR